MQNTKVWLNTNLQTLGTLKPWKSLKPTLSMNSILINWPHLISAKAALKYNFTQLPLDSQKTNWASVSKILRQQQKAEKQCVLSVHHVQHCNDTPAMTNYMCRTKIMHLEQENPRPGSPTLHTVPILLSRDGEIILPSWKMLELSCHVWDESWAGTRDAGERRFSAAGHRKKGTSVFPVKFLCITRTWRPVRPRRDWVFHEEQKGFLKITVDHFLKYNSHCSTW